METEHVHDLSTWVWWEQLAQDARHALRVFRRSPAFAVTAVLMLALGVGANGAMFSVVDALVLRPLPVMDPNALVVVRDSENGNFSYPDYTSLRGDALLSALVASSSLLRVPVAIGGEAERASVKIVSANYFEGLGVAGGVGRLMGGRDDAEPLAVLSDGYWARRFARAPDVLGRQITVNGAMLTIVGIAPPGFFGDTPGESPEVWASMAVQRQFLLNERGFSWLNPIGRLKAGVTPAQARASLAARFAGVADPSIKRASTRLSLTPGAGGLSVWRDRVGSPLRILTAIVGLVLLVACANLATLLLMRGVTRGHEIALRMALGASRRRVFRQLLTEACLLSAAGGLVSVPLTTWGARILVRMASNLGPGAPLVLVTPVNGRLLLFTAAAAALAGALFAVPPAIREVRRASVRLADGSRRVIAGDRTWGLRGVLMAVQVALCFVLVAGSVMFLRTLGNLESQDLGFRPRGLFRVEIEPERGHELDLPTVSRLIDRVTAVPGVDSATAVAGGTLVGLGGVNGLQVDGFTPRDAQDQRARADWVGPDYFRTAGVRLVAGREFSSRDEANAPGVAVVNETAARFYFGNAAAAVGRRFVFNKRDYAIVGVSEDAKYASLRDSTPRLIYFAQLQNGSPNALEIRTTTTDAASVIAAVRAAVREVDPQLSPGEVLSVSERIDRTLGRERLLANLSSAFGVLTLLLVSTGVYGTLGYAVNRRTREIGVRIALGAGRLSVIGLVFRELAAVVIAGALAGAALSVLVGRLVQSLLFGLTPADAPTQMTSIGLLLGVALAAGVLPAWRASRLDAAEVLRQ